MESGKRNCPECKRLVRLCGGMSFFPQDPEVQCLLVEELHRLARDHDNAHVMIYKWLYNQREAPKVADLVRLAAEHRVVIQPDPNCEKCDGSGWVIIERNDCSGAERCSCLSRQSMLQDRASSPLPNPDRSRSSGVDPERR